MPETVTFPTRQHERLAHLIGAWEGPTRTWFDPGSTPKDARTRATFRTVADGHFVLQEYDSSLDGEAFAGAAFLGYDDKRRKFVTSWIDSFHNGTTAMQSEGDEDPDSQVNVLGSYEFDGQRWGWRTVLRLDGPDELLYQAYNIDPAGSEHLGIETRFARVG